MTESIGIVSAIALALLTVLAAWAIARFLVWRDGLRPHAGGRRGQERRGS